MKNKKTLYIIIIIVLLISISIFGYLIYSRNNSKFKTEYEKFNNRQGYINVNINNNNKINYINIDFIENVIKNKDSMMLFIGSPQNNFSRNIAETIVNVTNETDIDAVYYIKSDGLDYEKISDVLGDVFTEDKLNDGAVIFIVDGVVVSYNFKTVASHKDAMIKMDDDQLKGLKNIYINGIDFILESKKINGSYEN